MPQRLDDPVLTEYDSFGRLLRRAIADKFHFATLDFQSLDGVVKAIGLPPCELCTYCWNGKE